MAATDSNAHRVEIVSQSYSIPTAGQVVAIGGNSHLSVRPPGAWGTDSDWTYSLFNSFGGGLWAPIYSTRGVYMIGASGGHGAPENSDMVLFNFDTALWERLANTNGLTSNSAPLNTNQTNGSPYYEQLAGDGRVPAPVHLYANMSYLTAAQGGGPLGSYLKVTSQAVTNQSAQGGGISRFNLQTRLWTRLTNSVFTGAAWLLDYDSSCVKDEAAGRIYFSGGATHGSNTMYYLDLADLTVKSVTYSGTYNDHSGYPSVGMCEIDPVRRFILKFWGVVPAKRGLAIFDLNNISAGWKDVTAQVSGSWPVATGCWAYYPPDGCWYQREQSSGNTLWRLTVPTDLRNGAYTIDTVTLTGATMANRTSLGGQTAGHYKGFVYVDSIQCLAWFSGNPSNNQVFIMKPPAVQVFGLQFPLNGQTPVGSHTAFRLDSPQLNGLPLWGPANAGVTYIWECIPQTQNGYYTTFFYAQSDGQFNVNADNDTGYYGAHPWPPGGESGSTHRWEIPIRGGDETNTDLGFGNFAAVTKGAKRLQALRITKNGNGTTTLKFYVNLPSTAAGDIITTTVPAGYGDSYRSGMPFALFFGDALWAHQYPWQNERGMILGRVKVIAKDTGLTNMLAEAADMTRAATADGLSSMWWGKKTFSLDDVTNGPLCDYGTARRAVWHTANRPARVAF